MESCNDNKGESESIKFHTVEGDSNNNGKIFSKENINKCDEKTEETKTNEGVNVLQKIDESSDVKTDSQTQINHFSKPSGSAVTKRTNENIIRKEKKSRLGHRRVGSDGQVTYKSIKTSKIMGSIQLGLENAIGSLASIPERDLLMRDFMRVESTTFASDGTECTPAHRYPQFVFKSYAPMAFRHFRDLFGIKPEDFLLSLCKKPLKELPNSGASGSIFYLADDDKFIIKTTQRKECLFLQNLLPGYYLNLHQNPKTLLPKFFGLYCYRCDTKNIRLVAMNNILPSTIEMHQKYDLKGSTYKREIDKLKVKDVKSPTYKDLDFVRHHPEGLFVDTDTYNTIIKTIRRDCTVLESFRIMDYSLLLGIHNVEANNDEKALTPANVSENPQITVTDNQTKIITNNYNEDVTALMGKFPTLKCAKPPSALKAYPNKSIRLTGNNLDNYSEDVLSGGIPAKNSRDEKLLVFMGIIDILQSYRLTKKLEHAWKSVVHKGDTISVHNPGFYSQRFQKFIIDSVFKIIPTKTVVERKITRKSTKLPDGQNTTSKAAAV
ncbi:phosphatidylinositol 4-phosphate 5-kinase type-1 alpha-like isoform X2 [Lycorma delicatula]